MVSLKRKATLESDRGSSKRRQPVSTDPYVDPSGIEDEDSSVDGDQDGADFVDEETDAESVDQSSDAEEAEEGNDVENKMGKHGKAKSADRLYKAPTNDEMQQLKETSDLFKSNLFKLQIDELLNEVRINHNTTGPLEKALHKLKEIMDAMSDIPETSVLEATSKLASSGIAVPFPHPPPPADAQYKFGFKKPSKIFIVGSYLLKMVAKSPEGANVDVAVQMPETIFQEKDHMNYRYLYKRAFYLAVLAKEMRKRHKEFPVTIKFQAFNGDRRRPILVLRSREEGASEADFGSLGFCIRIFPVISPNLFLPTRLAPDRNNVRPNFIDPAAKTPTDLPPTPRYNAAILYDTVLVPHLNILHHHVTNCAGFRDAAILSKIWLTQRGFGKAPGSFNGFLFAMIMGYLLRTSDKNGVRRLANSFSSYQLFKVTMEYIATHDFDAEPIFMTEDGKPLSDVEFSKETFVKNYDVVIVDPSGRVNLAAGMSRGMLDELQHEARVSMRMLNDTGSDHFDSLFLKTINVLHLRYDNVARIAGAPNRSPTYSQTASLDFPDHHLFLQTKIPKILKRALTNRALLVTAHMKALPDWPCDKEPITYADVSSPIYVGLVLDPENAIRVVEHGPPPEDSAASDAFRAMWGEKAELRRFKDGSILESVVFDCDGTLDQRSLIVGRMVGFLLERHFGIAAKGESLTYWAGQFSRFIRAPGIDMAALSYQMVMDAFSAFAKELRSLDELPLGITNVIPCAEGLRYTSVFIPQPRPSDERLKGGYRPLIEPLDVMIEFESSGRWPDDLGAIAQMKLAFYIRIAEVITQHTPGTRATVAKDDGGYIDITPLSGFTFRCRIHHDREELLHERRLGKGDDQAENDFYKSAQAEYYRRYHHLPYHSLRIQNLCLRHPFLPYAIRLLKRWVGAHMLSNQIPAELLELIAAKVFVDAAPYSEPHSPYVGFIRALELIRSWDWGKEALVVHLEKGETVQVGAAASSVEDGAIGGAEGLKPGAMRIQTEKDTAGVWWGQEKPTLMVVHRLVALAKAALKHVDVAFQTGIEKGLAKLFITPAQGYDMVLQLHPHKCPRFRQSLTYDPACLPKVKSKYKNLVSAQDRELVLLTEFDPVERYLAELEAAYGEGATFFNDRYGGTAIAVVFNRKALAHGTWKVGLPFNATPLSHVTEIKPKKKATKETWRVTPNFAAMAAEMERLGTGLVAGVGVDLDA
ncbi:hypothetical protein HDV00_007333 [Rhizophlyctis rosea]|nr:hypothetical protein HDV00_007333 [Rhizophlyctis rosea]